MLYSLIPLHSWFKYCIRYCAIHIVFINNLQKNKTRVYIPTLSISLLEMTLALFRGQI